ncbi:MAG: 2-phosphoglycerate kinase [Candidatus Lokiarchaeota archaeon]|nr:2-phosphoglycerate kinase [Candidatus Lokiarchaeota archaeon]
MDKILIIDQDYSIIFSRGLIANSLLKTGISFLEAHEIAEEIKNDLLKMNIRKISKQEMDKKISKILVEKKGTQYAENFLVFKKIIKLEQPIIILISGTTGIGKSTVALTLAHRLDFRSMIGTDSIREIMRKVLSTDLVPELHQSSYEAGKFSKHYRSSRFNSTILGYSEQVKIVTVGVEALIKRALYEGHNMIIEGVHLSPEFLSIDILEHPNVVFVMLNLSNEIQHKNRFSLRAHNVSMRSPVNKYYDNFEQIRIIQEYLKEQAKIVGVPIVENINRDDTVKKLAEIVTTRIKKILEAKNEDINL